MKVSEKDYELIKNRIKNIVDFNGLSTVISYHNHIIEKKLYFKDSRVHLMFTLKTLSNAFEDIEKDKYNDNHLETALLKIGRELNIYE